MVDLLFFFVEVVVAVLLVFFEVVGFCFEVVRPTEGPDVKFKDFYH